MIVGVPLLAHIEGGSRASGPAVWVASLAICGSAWPDGWAKRVNRYPRPGRCWGDRLRREPVGGQAPVAGRAGGECAQGVAGERSRDRDIRWPWHGGPGENRPVAHLPRERLMAGLGQIRASPQDGGRVVLVVRRSAVGQRELPTEAVLDQNAGLVGDNWLARGSKSMADGSADPSAMLLLPRASQLSPTSPAFWSRTASVGSSRWPTAERRTTSTTRPPSWGEARIWPRPAIRRSRGKCSTGRFSPGPPCQGHQISRSLEGSPATP